MPAPNRIISKIGSLDISAILLPEMSDNKAIEIVCKACAPEKTRMKALALLTTYHAGYDMYYAVSVCRNCGRQWAVPYRLLHTEKGVL